MQNNWIRIIPFLFLLFACSAIRSSPTYIASLDMVRKLQPHREIIKARKDCNICHKILSERLIYKYYPIKISHKSHVMMGIECAFCHRDASSSIKAADYLMPLGHGFNDKESDKNPCKVCHLYSSNLGMQDKLIPAKCETCHYSYSDKKPLSYRWVWKSANLINNHKTHYDLGIACVRCHPGFDVIEETTLNFTPKMDICMECHNAEGERKGEIEKIDTDPFVAAKMLYRQNCAMCHGKSGKGDGHTASFFKAGLKPRDFTDSTHMSKRTDQDLIDIILKGGEETGLSERMPAWEGLLKDDEVKTIIKYIRHLSEKSN